MAGIVGRDRAVAGDAHDLAHAVGAILRLILEGVAVAERHEHCACAVKDDA
jgi:hypothetical protein